MSLPKTVPIDNRVLIRMDAEPKYEGRLVIPDTAKRKVDLGTVVAVGPGSPRRDGPGRCEMQVLVGNRVLVGKYAGQEVEINGESLSVLLETDILLVFPDEA